MSLSTIGYFISRAKMKKLKAGRVDSVYRTFLTGAQLLGGIAFLFCVDDIEPTSLSVKGYTFDGTYSIDLIAKQYPFPRVIYNRSFGTNSNAELEQMISYVGASSLLVNPPVDDAIYKHLLNEGPEAPNIEMMGFPVQLKVLVQKNWLNKWVFTGGAACLKAEANPILSASYFDLDQVIGEHFADNSGVKQNIIKESLTLATEAGTLQPDLIELEIVLDLNINGTVTTRKIITKPSKKFITHFKHSKMFLHSILHPLTYCLTLAGLPFSSEPKVFVEMHNRVHPVIGIFEGLECLEAIRNNTPYTYQLNLAQAAKELDCKVLHFSLNELRGINCIEGWYFDHGKNQWVQKSFPWPDVFYDRGTFGYTKDREVAKAFRKQLKKIGNSLFLNSRSIFGKGTTGQTLEQFPNLRPYLPQTFYEVRSSFVRKLLDQFPSVYIKTEYGSQHNGVWEINHVNGSFNCITFNKCNTYSTFKDLWSYLETLVGSDSLIAQQGIEAVPYKSRSLNFRAIVQKSGSGEWEVALLKPWLEKTAESPSLSLQWHETMLELYGCEQDVNKIFQEMSQVSLNTAKNLEAYLGPLAELGIDLILDKSDHPWLIEVNGKSAKIFFVENDEPAKQHHIYYNPIAYGCYLIRDKYLRKADN